MLRATVGILAGLVACGEAGERGRAGVDPALWVRPVPEGVPTIAYSPVPPEARTAVIRVVRELEIGERAGDTNYQIGAVAPHVSVDEQGRIYVADIGNDRALIYDSTGEHLRTIGRRGEGPGEFVQPMVAIAAGGKLYVSNTASGRLSRWTPDGELDWDRLLDVFPGYLIPPSVALADGTWLTRFRLPRTTIEVVAHISSEGERIGEFAALEVPERTGYPVDRPRVMVYAGETPPTFAADMDGRVYVSPLAEYQIYAYALDGSLRWALQVPSVRNPLAEPEKIWATEWFRDQGFRDIEVGDVEWPPAEYALSDVKVDGEGQVFAFPWSPRGMEHDRLAVDVFAPDGTRLLAGWLDGDIEGLYWPGSYKRGPMLYEGWQTARGDRVWGVIEDPATGVFTVVRYRLEFPSAEDSGSFRTRRLKRPQRD